MRKITEQELNEILEEHKRWLKKEPGAKQGDLSYVDFRHMQSCLKGRDLLQVNLEGADLRGVSLRGTNINHAYTNKARLCL